MIGQPGNRLTGIRGGDGGNAYHPGRADRLDFLLSRLVWLAAINLAVTAAIFVKVVLLPPG